MIQKFLNSQINSLNILETSKLQIYQKQPDFKKKHFRSIAKKSSKLTTTKTIKRLPITIKTKTPVKKK